MANISKIRLSGTTYNIVDDSAIHDLSAYYTATQTDNQITTATNALAQTIAEEGYQDATDVNNAITAVTNPISTTLNTHTGNTDIHVTLADKTAWNAKLDQNDIDGLFGYVSYDSVSHRINFKNNQEGTVLGYVDASPFLVDGMVDTVAVSGGNLTITFNTDAGKQDIVIPISEIFDASNYYTTGQTQTYVQGYTYDKATIDQKVASGGTFDPTQYYTKTETNNLLSDKANTATTYTKTEVNTAISTATATKQDTLVSGSNIKTVGGESLLGSGNVQITRASIGTGVDSETLILTVQ